MSHTCRRHSETESESPIDSHVPPFQVRRSSNCLQLIQGNGNKEVNPLTVEEQKMVGYSFRVLKQPFRKLTRKFKTKDRWIGDSIINYYENGWYRETPNRRAA